MSMTSRRNGTGRVYGRRFDHEEAARLRFEEGVPVTVIAERFGVTAKRVYQVTTPGVKERMKATGRAWRTTVCETCGGPAMKLVGGKGPHNPDGRVLCHGCRSTERVERIRFDDEGNPATVRCMTCRRWLTLARFPRGDRHRQIREGGIHTQCRDCLTIARREYRDRHKVPCVGCGKPALPPNEKTSHGVAFPRCRECFYADQRAARRGEATGATGRAEG